MSHSIQGRASVLPRVLGPACPGVLVTRSLLSAATSPSVDRPSLPAGHGDVVAKYKKIQRHRQPIINFSFFSLFFAAAEDIDSCVYGGRDLGSQVAGPSLADRHATSFRRRLPTAHFRGDRLFITSFDVVITFQDVFLYFILSSQIDLY